MTTGLLELSGITKSYGSRRVLDDVSFEASDRGEQTVVIDGPYVTERVGSLSKNADLSRFIL